ncbi:calcium-binding protein CP1-like [Cornus florida]|uniref:calcium-binding protein CP1-like n=1 Tax=Cornus florida TaxID=4283 RepID=UPI00289AA6E2|nr:calcium-binding protein CP1-like [Cornus florida]
MCPTGSALRHPQTTKMSDFRPAFEVLDADRDGKISRDDLQTFYAGFSGTTASSSEDIIGSMISVADLNKDGYVEYDEFERVLNGRKRRERSGGRGVMEDVFKIMDKDGDGKVGQDDLKSYFSWAGFDATDDDIKAMIRLGGGDEEGGVTYDGFLKILGL